MMTGFGRTIVALAFVFAAGPALAAGGSSDTKDSVTQDKDYVAAEKAIQAGKFDDGVALLTKLVARDPKNADAWNYIGFADRKLGKFPESLDAYQRALAINPDHRGAIEYLGELYIATGNLAKAKEQLAKLDKLCSFGCDEYTQLKAAIAAGKSASNDAGDSSGSSKKW